MKLSLLVLAPVALALPAVNIEQRTGGGGFGTCPADSQYSCVTNGLLNILTCDSILSGNTISISLDGLLGGILGKRNGYPPATTTKKPAGYPTPTPTKPTGYPPTTKPTPTYPATSTPTYPPTTTSPTAGGGYPTDKPKPSGTPYCCKTNGLLNVLTCTNLLSGNTITVGLGSILGL